MKQETKTGIGIALGGAALAGILGGIAHALSKGGQVGSQTLKGPKKPPKKGCGGCGR